MRPVKILIADDSDAFRETIKIPLAGLRNVVVVGEANDGDEAVRKSRDLKPDAVLMDISMPGLNGLEATKLIKEADPSIAVFIVTAHDNPEYRSSAAAVKADAYLLKKDLSADSLLKAVESARSRSVDPPEKRSRSGEDPMEPH